MRTGERSDKCDRGGKYFLQENILIFCLFSSDIIGSPKICSQAQNIGFVLCPEFLRLHERQHVEEILGNIVILLQEENQT